MQKTRAHYVLYFLFLFSIGLLIFSSLTFKVDNVRIDNEDVSTFNVGWNYVSSDGITSRITLPNKMSTNAYEIIKINNQIPKNMEGLTLAFLTSDQLLKVSFDGSETYSFGLHDIRPFGKAPGTSWHFIQIPNGMTDGKVEIELSSPYKNRDIQLPTIYIGTKSACVFHLLKSNIIGFVLCCIILFFGGSLIILSFIIKNLNVKTSNLFYLGLFSIIMSFASMIETRLLQLFLGNQSVFSNCIFLLHMLAPIPMILYLGESFLSGMRKKFQTIAYAFVVNFIIIVGLHVSNTADFLETSLIFHILLILTSIYIFVAMIKLIISYKWNSRLLCFCSAQLVLISSIIMDILRYYLYNSDDVTLYQRMGLLLYLTTLSFLEINKVISLMKQGTEAESLRHLAYEDVLTKCKNRIYFEEKFTEAESELHQKLYIGIAIFDVNNLKKINDHRGHSEGDSMLIHAAGLINRHFSEYAMVCRIGGDEFAFVVTDVPQFQMERIFNRFKQAMRVEKENEEIGFDIAYGYAYFNPDIDRDLQGTFNRADSKMYARKKKMKDAINK